VYTFDLEALAISALTWDRCSAVHVPEEPDPGDFAQLPFALLTTTMVTARLGAPAPFLAKAFDRQKDIFGFSINVNSAIQCH
jgi:hypothetical protein